MYYSFLNAFSLNMVKCRETQVSITEISLAEVIDILRNNNCKSYVGHQDLCNILNDMLNFTVAFNRENFYFSEECDKAIVAQYSGNRLPEGTTTLPENSEIKFFTVKVK